MENGKATIDRIDHGVLPSNDLGRAHRFYSTFMGGELDHFTNLTIRGLNREVPQILFYTLANHKGWGLALQDFPIDDPVKLPPLVWAVLMTSVSRVLVLERALDMSAGHRETVEIVESYLRHIEGDPEV